MTKATISKDGLKRFSMAVTFRVGRWDLITAAAWAICDDTEYGVRPTIDEASRKIKSVRSRTALLRCMRERLDEDGPWNDGSWDNDEVAAHENIATEIVDRLFPELGQEAVHG